MINARRLKYYKGGAKMLIGPKGVTCELIDFFLADFILGKLGSKFERIISSHISICKKCSDKFWDEHIRVFPFNKNPDLVLARVEEAEQGLQKALLQTMQN